MSSANVNSDAVPGETTPELKAYYADSKLMWRNIFWLGVLTVGWSKVFTIVSPLMTLRLNSPEVGLGEAAIGMIGSINGYAVSFLVMYFSWKSDHTVSRWGRRIPFLWISSPGIIISVILFPFFHDKWMLIGLVLMQMFFMDMKNSTISLLPIDLVPRSFLARTQSIQNVVQGLLGFLVLRYGMKLADVSEKLPYILGGVTLLITTFTSGFYMKEPPIRNPTTETFKPWSALKIGWRDRRVIVIMVGVALLGSFNVMYNSWIWLFAKNVLHLTRTDMGAALSWASLLSLALAFPSAWILDRFNAYKVLGVYLLTQFGLCALMMRIHDVTGLLIVSFIWTMTCGFTWAAGLMVIRACLPHEVGSVTSSMAFINNAYNATLIFVSGFLIERLGHQYQWAYLLGLTMTCIGFIVLLVYRRMMLNDAAAQAQAQVQAPCERST